MAPDQISMRFGMMAVQKGFVTAQNVVDALEIQAREYFSIGRHRLIGEILVDQGYLDQGQLNEIILLL